MMTDAEEPARSVRILFVLNAFLTLAAGLGLAAALHFPEVLLDGRSFAGALVDAGLVAVVASLAAMVAGGWVQVRLARAVASGTPENRRMLRIGEAAGICWAASGVLGLVLVPLWAADVSAGVSASSRLVFVTATIAVPLLLAVWTVLVRSRFRRARVLAIIGVIGLVLTALRSAVWWLATFLPVDEAPYFVSAVLTVLTLLTFPVWICWLVQMGLGVRKRVVFGFMATVFAVAHAVAMVIATPTPITDDVPAVPSAGGTLRYLVGWVLQDAFALPTSYQDLLAQREQVVATAPEVPEGVTREEVDAGGVPVERICANGARTDRVLIYFPGGGFIMPPGNANRGFASNVSRAAGACVVLVHYRLAPEHPFPAAVDDGVTVFRWLRQQGVAAAGIGIFGDSAGGNLTLTVTLSLRDKGEQLPAALVSVSPCTDFTLSGRTWDTKAATETLILRDTKDLTFRSYARGGTSNLHDPLLSPQFADLTGMPSTMMMVGSQEVLLDDSVRMANRLRGYGVESRLEVWPGMPHAWNGARKETLETRLTVHHIATWLSARLN
jgi:acetyl esterase/lipase